MFHCSICGRALSEKEALVHQGKDGKKEIICPACFEKEVGIDYETFRYLPLPPRECKTDVLRRALLPRHHRLCIHREGLALRPARHRADHPRLPLLQPHGQAEDEEKTKYPEMKESHLPQGKRLSFVSRTHGGSLPYHRQTTATISVMPLTAHHASIILTMSRRLTMPSRCFSSSSTGTRLMCFS